MMTEQLASAILSSSITGAGLVVAIFGVLIPISDIIAQFRKSQLKELLEKFQSGVSKLKDNSTITDGDLSSLREILEDAEEKASTPKFQSRLFVLGSFILYISSALFSYAWLADKTINPDFLAYSFVSATILFTIVGLSTLANVLDLLKYTSKK